MIARVLLRSAPCLIKSEVPMRKLFLSSKVPIAAPLTLALLLLLGASLACPGSANAGEYDPDEAGNPVHIAGSIAYPAGYVYELIVLKPAHWLGQRTPFRQLFGEETFDEAYDW